MRELWVGEEIVACPRARDWMLTPAARAWRPLRYDGHENVVCSMVGFMPGSQPVFGYGGRSAAKRRFPAPGPGHMAVLDAAGGAGGRGADLGPPVDALVAQRYRGEHEPVDPVACYFPAWSACR